MVSGARGSSSRENSPWPRSRQRRSDRVARCRSRPRPGSRYPAPAPATIGRMGDRRWTLTIVSAPMMWPRATIGTIIPDRMFIARRSSRCSGLRDCSMSILSFTSGANTISPVRMTLARAVDAFLSILDLALTSVMCWSSDLSMDEAASCLISSPMSTSTHAPIGDGRDSKLGRRRERALVVERRRQHAADLVQQFEPLGLLCGFTPRTVRHVERVLELLVHELQLAREMPRPLVDLLRHRATMADTRRVAAARGPRHHYMSALVPLASCPGAHRDAGWRCARQPDVVLVEREAPEVCPTFPTPSTSQRVPAPARPPVSVNARMNATSARFSSTRKRSESVGNVCCTRIPTPSPPPPS